MTPLLTGADEKSVWSQPVAAALDRASRGSVPTHGFSHARHGRQVDLGEHRGHRGGRHRRGLADPGGRHARPGVLPRLHSPETASARSPAERCADGWSPTGNRVSVVVTSWPVRATPATTSVPSPAQVRRSSSIASSPTPSTVWVPTSWARSLSQAANQPTAVSKPRAAARSDRETWAVWTAVGARRPDGGEPSDQGGGPLRVGVPVGLAGHHEAGAGGVAIGAGLGPPGAGRRARHLVGAEERVRRQVDGAVSVLGEDAPPAGLRPRSP